jgi:prolyl 4-hydroxylase
LTLSPALVESLRESARSGDVKAMSLLGQALLRAGSTPADLREAEATLAAADRAGDAEAPAVLAMLSATGVGAPRDWTRAMGLLVVAAERGSANARGQLQTLGSEAVHADGGGQDWARLAGSLDLTAWTQHPAKRVLSVTPRVATMEGFVSPRVCAWMIARADERIAPAQVFDAETGAASFADARSNSAVEFGFGDLDVVQALLRAYIALSIDVPEGALEPSQVLHYAVGQSFAPHYDFLDTRVPGYAIEAATNGQRLATFLIYLNDGFEGGETDFPLLHLRAKAPPGGALYFANVDAAGAPDPRTLHAGLAPTSGEKWLLSQWVRSRGPN